METVEIADLEPAIREMLERITIIEKQLAPFTRRIDHLTRSLDNLYGHVKLTYPPVSQPKEPRHANLVKPGT